MDEKKLLPVFFVHSGNQEYLSYTIRQAEKYNNLVYLLGDESNKQYTDNWYDMDTFITCTFEKFTNIYKHMSSNPFIFELNCFRRFFVSYEFAKEKGIESFILLDSDLMSYVNYSDLNFEPYDLAISIPKDQSGYNWTASPHCSYWTLNALDKFLEYLEFKYTQDLDDLYEKWNYHQHEKISGGICDMTLLYLWINHDTTLTIFNTIRIQNNTVFDHFLSVTGGYEKGTFNYWKFIKIKALKFDKGIPYFITNENQKIRTYTIHAQGKSKIFISTLFECRSDKIFYIWCSIVDIKTRFKGKIGRWYE